VGLHVCDTDRFLALLFDDLWNCLSASSGSRSGADAVALMSGSFTVDWLFV